MRLKTIFFCIFLFSLGCIDEDQDYIDIAEYIEYSCTGESDIVFFIDSKFTEDNLDTIIRSVDYANNSLSKKIEICGTMEYDERSDENFVRYAVDENRPYRTGYYNGDGVISLYPEGRVRSQTHLQKLFLHELGHFWGAGHSLDTNDIMCQGWNFVYEYSLNDTSKIEDSIEKYW